jgi:hypothetical protein
MLMPVQRITIGITLLLFFSSAFFGSWEGLSARFDPGSQTSLWALENEFSLENRVKRRALQRSQRSESEDDSSSESAVTRRALKRSQRGKPSLSSLPASNKPVHANSFLIPVRETPFIAHRSKSSVYQQINVYRI